MTTTNTRSLVTPLYGPDELTEPADSSAIPYEKGYCRQCYDGAGQDHPADDQHQEHGFKPGQQRQTARAPTANAARFNFAMGGASNEVDYAQVVRLSRV